MLNTEPCLYRHTLRRTLAFALHALALCLGSGASFADGDHDRARQALEAGEVLPLRTILEGVEREFPGRVVDVELERDRINTQGRSEERWVYRIKLLRAGGALVKLKVDARDGRIIGSKGSEQKNHRGEEH